MSKERRAYKPRIVGDKGHAADLSAFINTCSMLNTSALSLTRRGRWSNELWPELAHKLPPKPQG